MLSSNLRWSCGSGRLARRQPVLPKTRFRSSVGAWLSLARAPGSGPGGRWFKSTRPDHYDLRSCHGSFTSCAAKKTGSVTSAARETFPSGWHATIVVKYKPRGIDDFSASSTPNSSSRNPRPSRARNFSRPREEREAERCPFSAAPVLLSHFLGGASPPPAIPFNGRRSLRFGGASRLPGSRAVCSVILSRVSEGEPQGELHESGHA
jgi:hypothetical protein